MSIYQKIFNVQQALEPIKKDLENPFFHSSYFDVNRVIDVLKPLLKQEGLVVIQPLSNLDGKAAIKTIVATQDGSEKIEEPFPLMESQDIQKQGGVITYTRRYALVSMFLIQGDEDDDGNAASGVKPKVHIDEPFADNQPAKDIAPSCPKCGGEMAQRKGKYGPFFGCKSYPNCDGMSKV